MEDSDNGLHVPAVLLQLKQSIMKYGGLQQEGIFRISGSENRMKDIKFELNTNTFIESNDVYSCAGLIKVFPDICDVTHEWRQRWYGELPRRIFVSVSAQRIEQAIDDINESMAIVEALPKSEKVLYLWLLDLMYHTALLQEVNKMSPENIAICVAPQLVEINADNPMVSLHCYSLLSVLIVA